jgi:hypothetical protein
MSDSVEKEENAFDKHDSVEAEDVDGREKDGDGGLKRRRGPEDCLNWESDEEEFTPFTQERIFTPREVPVSKGRAKKSVVKGIAKKSGFKKARLKSGKANPSGYYL